MSTSSNVASEISGLEDLNLEIKIANVANKPNRVRLFSRLTHNQYEYILEHMESIQLWMFIKSKYASGHGDNRVTTKTKWRHPNNVPVGIGGVAILPDVSTANIATSKLFPPTVYNYGGEHRAGGYFNRPIVGLGIGNGNYYSYDTIEQVSAPVDISHSLTGGFVPTEFKLSQSNLVTLLDGSWSLQIDIYLQNFTDNLAYETYVNQPTLYCRMVAYAPDRLRFHNLGANADAKKQRQFFKFCLTELRHGQKVDTKLTTQTLTAQLATKRLNHSGDIYSDFISPRTIGFAVWS